MSNRLHQLILGAGLLGLAAGAWAQGGPDAGPHGDGNGGWGHGEYHHRHHHHHHHHHHHRHHGWVMTVATMAGTVIAAANTATAG